MKLLLTSSLFVNACLALILLSNGSSDNVEFNDGESSILIAQDTINHEKVSSAFSPAIGVSKCPPPVIEKSTCPEITVTDFQEQIDDAVYEKLNFIAEEDMTVFAYLESDGIGEYEVDGTGLLKVKDWYDYKEIEAVLPMLDDERKTNLLDTLNTSSGVFKEALIKEINKRPVTGHQEKDAFYAAIDSFDYESTSAVMMMELELMRKCHFQRDEIDLVLLGRLVNPEIRDAAQKRDVVALQKVLDKMVC